MTNYELHVPESTSLSQDFIITCEMEWLCLINSRNLLLTKCDWSPDVWCSKQYFS